MYVTPSNQLYQPLRITLDKSIVSNQNTDIQKSRVFQTFGATSRVSKRMRSLSPQQANYIKQSTILPIDKDLVPTNNLWKIRGKQFSAVNVQVKSGPPIPSSMMHILPGMRGGQITTQTLYQIRPSKSSLQNIASTRSIANLRTVFPPTGQITNYPSQIVLNPVSTSEDFRRPASPVRVSSKINLPSFLPSASNEYQIPAPRPVQSMNSESHLAQTTANSYKQQKNYKEQKIFNTFEKRPESSKPKYKYNFFSALDQAVNTGCGSCGGNEIIASKPHSSWQ